MATKKKTIEVNEQEREEMFARLIHAGSRFENKLADKINVSYQYTKPGEVPKYKKNLMLDITEYIATSPDLSKIPKGNSKYSYWDRCRDLFQGNLIDKIEHDKGDSNTFLLYARPRIEVLSTGIFRMKLEGVWVDDKKVKQIDGPIEFEEKFPHE